jgi:hypothetical protein
LTWRTLRAAVGTIDYVTRQPFFKRAPESNKSRQQVVRDAEALNDSDPALKKLRYEQTALGHQLDDLFPDNNGPLNLSIPFLKIYEYTQMYLHRTDVDIQRAKDATLAKAAGRDPKDAKPGNTEVDLVANDKTDLLAAAEEFRVLLTWLAPDQANQWLTRISEENNMPFLEHEQATSMHKTDTTFLRMGDIDFCRHFEPLSGFKTSHDNVITPLPDLKKFLYAHTSPASVFKLRDNRAAIALFDDYVHDSRAWFRMPNFREYAPGGYFWARVFFVGGDQRILHLGWPEASKARAA